MRTLPSSLGLLLVRARRQARQRVGRRVGLGVGRAVGSILQSLHMRLRLLEGRLVLLGPIRIAEADREDRVLELAAREVPRAPCRGELDRQRRGLLPLPVRADEGERRVQRLHPVVPRPLRALEHHVERLADDHAPAALPGRARRAGDSRGQAADAQLYVGQHAGGRVPRVLFQGRLLLQVAPQFGLPVIQHLQMKMETIFRGTLKHKHGKYFDLSNKGSVIMAELSRIL